MKIKCNKCGKEYFDLEKRKCDCGGVIFPLRGKDSFWSVANLVQAFNRYKRENGHYPTAQEVDSCSYLPAARQVQRRFGGLVSFRRQNNLGNDNYTKGEYRSKIATNLNSESKRLEKEYFKKLKSIFGEPFVHREKPISDDFKYRYDFFIYTKTGNFGIDIFKPNDIRNLKTCINLKLGKLSIIEKIDKGRTSTLYIVNVNNSIDQKEMDSAMKNKKTEIPDGVEIFSQREFLKMLNNKLAKEEIKPYILS